MAERHIEKSYKSESIETVSIKNYNGRILFRGWSNDEIKVIAHIKVDGPEVFDDILPVFKQKDKHLGIASRPGGKGRQGIDDSIVENISHMGEKIQQAMAGIFGEDGPISVEFGDDQSSSERKISIKTSVKETLDSVKEEMKEIKKEGKRIAREFSEIDLEGVGRSKEDFDRSMHGEISINYEVFIPDELKLSAKCVNGPIHLEDITAIAELKTTNGPIKIQGFRGKLYAKTLNGMIQLDAGSAKSIKLKSLNGPIRTSLRSLGDEIMIKSLNGPIRLNLPSDSSAILNASAPSGAIKVSSEFNASVRSLHKYSGQRGQGDCAISLKTLTGPITVAVSDEKTEANSPAVPITVPPVPPKTPEPSMPPEPPKPDQTHVYPESQHPDEDNSEKVESPEAMVDRMLQEGKISPEEARQLKSSL